ncbi:MAG: hypothetical protein AAF611_08275 [Bacteroidota bacterium]
MSEKAKTKGIDFVPANAVSDEAKHKLNEMMKRKKENLEKLVRDYKEGVLLPQN